MSAAMLNLTDTSGQIVNLPIAVSTPDERLTQNKITDAKDGRYLEDASYYIDGIMNWDNDSWQLGE